VLLLVMHRHNGDARSLEEKQLVEQLFMEDAADQQAIDRPAMDRLGGGAELVGGLKEVQQDRLSKAVRLAGDPIQQRLNDAAARRTLAVNQSPHDVVPAAAQAF